MNAPAPEKFNQLLEELGRRGRQPLPRGEVGALAVPALFNNKAKPHYEIVVEKPEHRTVCLLKVQGLTAREIAAKTDYSEDHVKTILHQPWAEKFILEEIHKQAQVGLDTVYKRYEAEALEIAHDLMKGEETPDKLRATCAFEILKIARGQKITIEDNRRSLDDLKKEQELIEQQLNSLGATDANGSN